MAAEESANQYVLKLMDAVNSDPRFEGVTFSGIGYESLKEKNFNVIFNAEKLAVMGALEVVKKWKSVKEAFDLSLDHIVKNKPAVVILIDFGGFNLKLAKAIKEKSPETQVHYFISPKLWVWGAKRALKVKAYVDQMYVIHPFEVEFYKNWGVDAKFVGHPLLDELKPYFFESEWKQSEKEKEGLSLENRVLGVMLGSRASEVSKHKGIFCSAVGILKKKHNTLDVVFIAPPSADVEEYSKELGALDFNFKILQSKDPMEKIALCDVCLVASGTATLQVGLLGIPMAIGYMMNPITMFLAKTFAKIRFAGLVNIIKDKEISKEFLQGDLKPEPVAAYLDELITSPGHYDDAKKELLSLRKELGEEKTYERLKDELASLV